MRWAPGGVGVCMCNLNLARTGLALHQIIDGGGRMKAGPRLASKVLLFRSEYANRQK